MREYIREYPQFSLCGLNCGLCPRYHTNGPSRCPGCGGPEFHLKHPGCAVITCSRKHGNVEYCFQCGSYPCDRYINTGETDSFITYHNVIKDFNKAREKGIEYYKAELNEKMSILETLLANYNDGRKKGFYCLAVNLLSLSDIRNVMQYINTEVEHKYMDRKEKIGLIVKAFEKSAQESNVELQLWK
jgi:hypothetical protein